MDADDMRSYIRSRMSGNPHGNPDNPGYWYPLAVPSYGPEEVMQALESMVTYRTTMWEKTRAFEDAFAARYGGSAVMVNSGSSADLLMMFALLKESGGTLEPGDEVCVPAVTWPTHLWSVLMAGLKPVLVDVDPHTLNMSAADLRKKVTRRTKVVFPVHLMGNPADMDAINEVADQNGLQVVEDGCEALGAQFDGKSVGSLGSAGSFSFFFSHHMTTMEGGMVLAADEDMAERLRLLRAHGWSRNLRHQPTSTDDGDGLDSELDPRYTFIGWGFNVRPTELQAGFGLEQLRRLPDFELQRQRNFDAFKSSLESAGLERYFRLPVLHPKSKPSWFALALMVDESAGFTRDSVTKFLNARGVETRPIVAGNLARHPVRLKFPEVFKGTYPGADRVHSMGFYVGLHPFPMEDELARFVELLLEFTETNGVGR